jgi:hypothetical protein
LLVVVVLLEILNSSLPDTSKVRSWVFGNSVPSGLRTEELHALCLGGDGGIELLSVLGACNAVELSDVLECVVLKDVLGDKRTLVEDHDCLGLAGAAVSDDGGLGEDLLLDLVAAAVVDSDLDFLDDEHDGGFIAELVLHVGLAEEVVQVVVEAVVDLVDDEDLVDLLHDLLLAAVVVDVDAEVLLLDLDDLLLLVEVVEAVGEVEAIAGEAVEDCAVEAVAEDVVALGDRGGDGAGGCGVC